MEDCIFCKIVKGEIPSEKIYEDNSTLAFLALHPDNVGHVLVISKSHSYNLYGIADEELCRLILSVKKVALAVKHGMDADGINLIANNEEAAGQMIFHLHFHVIPRFVNDGLNYAPSPRHYKEGEMKEVAEKIKKEIEK
jgi:histidine triad (HIT) family protein